MALKPGAEQIIRGIQRGLLAHVAPELSSPYATAQVNYAVLLLNALAAEWDGAAQRLVEDNAALRAFCGRAAAPLGGRDAPLAIELTAVAAETDPDVRISTLAGANDRLRGLLARILVLLGPDILEVDDALTQDIKQELRAGVARRGAGAL